MEENTEKKKLSYEELENVCHQLSEQSRALYERLQQSDMSNMFKRLDYLFKIIENEEVFMSRGKMEFVDKCVDELVTAMTIPEETKKEE